MLFVTLHGALPALHKRELMQKADAASCLLQPLMEAGLDSLSAVELRNTLGAHFKIEVPATLTFDYPSVSALAAFLAHQTATSGAMRRGTVLDVLSGAALAGAHASSALAQTSDIVGLACRYPGGAAWLPYYQMKWRHACTRPFIFCLVKMLSILLGPDA